MASHPIGDPPALSLLDCVSCGRCCFHEPSTVHLLDTDEERFRQAPGGEALLRRFTVLDLRPPGWRFVRNDGGCCAALDVTTRGLFPCRIYAVRPDDCRAVEPGSPCCLEARRLGRLGTSVEFVCAR
jgi:hypothetical protein